MITAKLSSKFQLSIPKAIREQLQVKEGQQFVFVPRGHIIELVPAQHLQEARGWLAGIGKGEEMDYRDRRERKPV